MIREPLGYNDSTAQGAVGIYGGNGITLEEGSVTNITVKGGVDNTNPVKDQIYGLGGATGMMGKIEAVGDININMPTAGGTGIKSFDYNGKSSHITGNLVVNTNAGTALATYRSPLTVDAPADKVVQLTGDVTNIRNTQNSILTVNFKNAESFLTGASLHATANTAKTTLNFSGGSLWNLTADSVATNLTNTDSIINMHYTGDDTYETIHMKPFIRIHTAVITAYWSWIRTWPVKRTVISCILSRPVQAAASSRSPTRA